MTLYMKTTTDKYELPIAVADSPKKLAMMLGQKRSSVATMCSQQRNGYHRIEVEPDECPAMIEEQNMEMTKKEICRNYLGAKKKRAQIEILADLNNTDKATIKEILKEGGCFGGKPGPKPKAATINQDFEDAVNEMIEQTEHKPLPEIEAADPVMGEIGYHEDSIKDLPILPVPPTGLTPRDIAEIQFRDSRIRDIIYAMYRYYEADKSITVEWKMELKERL